MAAGPDYAFGPFHLDTRRRQLLSNGAPVPLNDRHLSVLERLAAGAGDIVSKDQLAEAGWGDVAVTDNSVEQAISALRRALGAESGGAPVIETCARRGYRLTLPATRVAARETDAALEALLAPHRRFLEGVALVETLSADAIARAVQAFGLVVAAAPDHAPGHVGLANALVLTFEASRADAAPDLAALERAVEHAREGCRLEPGSGEAWATLAFAFARSGASTDAIAAGRRATSLEPDTWRHHVRLAYASWGEARLRAARQALRLLPGLALAHWLAATVYVARQSFDDALAELETGTTSGPDGAERFGAVGLHLLAGLVHGARGDTASAGRAFERELALEGTGHVYARESSAASWCAMGALAHHDGRAADALAAFDAALARVPGHPVALAARVALMGDAGTPRDRSELQARVARLEAAGAGVEAAAIGAVSAALAGRAGDAAAMVGAALAHAPAGSAGWALPVDALLVPFRQPDAWAGVLRTIRSRAA